MDSSLGEASRRAETVWAAYSVGVEVVVFFHFQPGMKWKIAGLQGGKQRTEGGPDAGGGTAEAAADGAGDVIEATADGAGDDLVGQSAHGWLAAYALTWPVSVFIPPTPLPRSVASRVPAPRAPALTRGAQRTGQPARLARDWMGVGVSPARVALQ